MCSGMCRLDAPRDKPRGERIQLLRPRPRCGALCSHPPRCTCSAHAPTTRRSQESPSHRPSTDFAGVIHRAVPPPVTFRDFLAPHQAGQSKSALIASNEQIHSSICSPGAMIANLHSSPQMSKLTHRFAPPGWQEQICSHRLK